MQLFGLEIRRAQKSATLSNVSNRGGWTPFIREPFTGAWQRDVEWTVDTVLAHHAVYSCITLIASDVGKLRPKLVQQDENGIWSEVEHSSPYARVLKKPNGYQNHIQFKEWWTISRLTRGNTYALKERDERGIVRALHLLDPMRVTVLVSEDGDVLYRLNSDNLSGVGQEGVVAPASEIIHDRMNCLFHPLVGVSPIFASGLSATVGLRIENNAANFFENGSNPSGILSAPGEINKSDADRIREHWENEYSGANAGKIAVLGSDLKFTPMRMTSVDAQMIEHLKWSAETVCNTFHVPHFKAGVGTQPTYQNGEVLNQIYYSDCLQSHIESFELCMDEGLGLNEGRIDGRQLGVELDVEEGLLRMDQAAQVKTLVEGLKGLYSPDEARRKVNLAPVDGGATPYLQQQNYSLAALAKRDAKADPFGKEAPATPVADAEDDGAVDRFFDLRARTLRLRLKAA